MTTRPTFSLQEDPGGEEDRQPAPLGGAGIAFRDGLLPYKKIALLRE